MEGWSTKGQYKEQDTKRKNVSGCSNAGCLSRVVDFRRHIGNSSQRFCHQGRYAMSKPKIAQLQPSFRRNKDIFQFKIHMGILSLLMQHDDCVNQLIEERFQKWLMVFEQAHGTFWFDLILTIVI